MQVYRSHSDVWQTNLPSDTYELRLWRVVFRQAAKRTGFYALTPAKQKRALRCDLCQFGKRKQALYARYDTLMLYCQMHYEEALLTPDKEEAEAIPPFIA